jgi:hypothetical protein
MKLHLCAATVAGGVISAGGLFIVALLFKLTGGSGEVFLRFCDGLFPLYHPHTGVANLILGLVNALIQGAIMALIVAWVYNLCVDLLSKKSEAKPQA